MLSQNTEVRNQFVTRNETKNSTKRQKSIISSLCLKIRRTCYSAGFCLLVVRTYIYTRTYFTRRRQIRHVERCHVSIFHLVTARGQGWGENVNNSGGAARPAKLSILLANIKTFSRDGIPNEVRGHAHPRPGGICGSRNTCLELIVRLYPARMEIGGPGGGWSRAWFARVALIRILGVLASVQF